MAGHGGNVEEIKRRAGKTEVLDFSASINPLGPPAWLRPLISRTIGELAHYPDPDCGDLINAAVDHFGVSAAEVIPANGTSEILYMLPHLRAWGRVVAPAPSYSDYTRPARLAGIEVVAPVWDAAADFAPNLEQLSDMLKPHDLVYLGHPNNPTGQALDPVATRALCAAHPDCLFVIDEAYLDFHDPAYSLIQQRPENALVLRSLTKFYAIPGLRLGLAFADPALATQILDNLPPWTVNEFALVTGTAALRDVAYATRSRTEMKRLRVALVEELEALGGLRVLGGCANFLLVEITRTGQDAQALSEALIPQGVAIRVCDNFAGLGKHYFRVAVRGDADNARLVTCLRAIFAGRTPQPRTKPRPALMMQGTSSHAGKSVLVAALCRILLQDGVRVAPFKAQNMALNSYVTHDGLEIGRAQATQARAARIEPDARINPVLLKPTGETGSQVIVMGKPVANMEVRQYHAYKETAFAQVKAAYDSLAQDYDAVILEGAGSPGEVNLKSHDIVNMRMAAYAKSPVLLTGDIDRGGVYAGFVGTLDVLEEWERRLIRGFVVNKFRGDRSLLADAHAYVTQHTGRPVLGVIPMISDLGLPEEDSVGFKESGDAPATRDDAVTVALIGLPHISNVTDADPFRNEPDVTLRIVRRVADLAGADAILLPGSKNVHADLAWLQETGLAEALLQHPAEIVGLCGGLQMMGQAIADPHGIEGNSATADGLGLLPLQTTLAQEKTLARIEAQHSASGLTVFGYEIHHGVTEAGDVDPLLTRIDGSPIGWGEGRVWASYLHGLFDADPFRRWWIDRLRISRGLSALAQVQAPYDLEPALDRLADVVRTALPMARIYEMMGL